MVPQSTRRSCQRQNSKTVLQQKRPMNLKMMSNRMEERCEPTNFKKAADNTLNLDQPNESASISEQ
uniref:Uncharacterized protein n=1 Tax=Arundo donax TaxID=35708 RepID=A0A0A9H3D0_ARUDO